MYSRKKHYRVECNTRELIQYLIKNYKIDSETKIFGLARLTWLGNKAKLDAFNNIFNSNYKSLNVLKHKVKDSRLQNFIDIETGFVNFYKAYRNVAYRWSKKNSKELKVLFNKTRNIKYRSDIRQIAQSIEELPLIPKANNPGIKMSSESLLTPLFACIDPTKRFPVITKNEDIVELHKSLGISNLALSERIDILIDVMEENRIKDSLYLDVYNESAFNKKILNIINENKKISKELIPRDDKDIKYLLTEKRKTVVRRHRKLEKDLIDFCKKKGIKIEEGVYSKLKFDALLKNYKKGRDLLIEIKGSNSYAELRLAIGQILDYRFEIKNNITDMVIFLPSKPPQKYIDIGRSLRIEFLWKDGKHILGTIKI